MMFGYIAAAYFTTGWATNPWWVRFIDRQWADPFATAEERAEARARISTPMPRILLILMWVLPFAWWLFVLPSQVFDTVVARRARRKARVTS